VDRLKVGNFSKSSDGLAEIEPADRQLNLKMSETRVQVSLKKKEDLYDLTQ
jgi:hypothetical protein